MARVVGPLFYAGLKLWPDAVTAKLAEARTVLIRMLKQA